MAPGPDKLLTPGLECSILEWILDLTRIKCNFYCCHKNVLQDTTCFQFLKEPTYILYYSGDLNTEQVWYLNGGKEVGYQMVWFFNAI